MRKPGSTFIRSGSIPAGGTRRDTAVLLVGIEAEYGLDNAVFSTPSGYYISDALATVLVKEGVISAEDVGGVYDDTMSAINNGVETGPVSGNEQPEESGEQPDFYDPADYKVDEVISEVEGADDLDFAVGVLDAETDGKNRKTLTEWLREYIHTASGNRAEENTNTSEEE